MCNRYYKFQYSRPNFQKQFLIYFYFSIQYCQKKLSTQYKINIKNIFKNRITMQMFISLIPIIYVAFLQLLCVCLCMVFGIIKFSFFSLLDPESIELLVNDLIGLVFFLISQNTFVNLLYAFLTN